MDRRSRTLLILLLLAALIIRLGWGLSRPADEASLAALPDQNEYLQIARSLLDGRGLSFYDDSVKQVVHAYRMPGYPLFVAVCGANVIVVRVVQAVLETSTVLAIYLLCPATRRRAGLAPPPPGEAGWGPDCEASQRSIAGSHLASPGGGGVRLIAAGLVAFNPYLIYFSATLLSETLFTAMLAWGMFLLLRTSRWAFLAGLVVLSASVYVRPGAIGLPILLAVGAELARAVGPVKRSFWRVPAGALAVGVMGLALLPWGLRNRYHEQVGAWVWTTTNGGITLYDGLNDRADGSSNQSAFRRWPELQSMTEVERSAYFAGQARQFAMEDPKRAVWLGWRKVLRTWSPFPLSAEYGSNRLYVLAGAVFAVPLFALTVAGVWYGRVGRSLKLFLLLPAIYFTLVHAVTVGSLRYRVPADAPMAVLAAIGVVAWTNRKSKPVE